MNTKSILLTLALSLMLSACGGGGSGSDSGGGASPTPTPPPPTTTPSPSEMIGNAKNYSVSELQSAALELVSNRYDGLTTPAELDVGFSQQAFIQFFASPETEVPDIFLLDFGSLVDANGNIDTSVVCDDQGQAEIKGKLATDLTGNISLSFSNCYLNENGYAMTGNAAISIQTFSEDVVDITFYFDELSWNWNGRPISASGYSSLDATIEGDYMSQVSVEQRVLFELAQEKIIHEASMVTDLGGESEVEVSGDIYFGSRGKVSFSVEGSNYLPPYLNSGKVLLEGSKLAAFEFEGEYIRYVEDSDGDGTYDVGTYFIDFYELLYGSAEDKLLVSLDILSIPPTVYRPYTNGDTFDTTTPVQVHPGSYYDPDTPEEELTISFRWYLNDEIVEGETSNTFPAYTAVFGDKLEVSMLVSDSSNVIESPKLRIELADAPMQVTFMNLPDVVAPGDLVSFIAHISDPDTGLSENSGVLVSGPDNATIAENGQVTWEVPTDTLLSHQNYTFTFGIADENGEITETTSAQITVESEKALPLARSGIEVPLYNKSMSVGDFDGDGTNEVLSTDSDSRVFLLAFDGTQYNQKWVYPYKQPTSGTIMQVLSANLDQDDELEIITVTQHGISVIDGLGSLARELFTTGAYLKFAAVKDIDSDGVMEIAYLYTDSQYSGDTQVNVISVDDAETSLFSTNVSSAEQMEFANVDEDDGLELVFNNGLVYDVETWENQWFNGTSFGNRSVTTGDYNNDGIDEIAGADTWGDITVYSAVDKAQLDSIDNFNTCTLHSADIDGDGSDELLVGDCQWGEITAYNLINNELSSLWALDMQDHGSVSLTSGDSDNDGKLELHWGTGISHSGENSFVTADVDGASASIKESAVSVQLDGYSSAGWSTIIGNEERAVFFVPSTANGYDGSRLALLDDTGRIELTGEISSNWDNSFHAATTDFNNDGLGDIFLPATSTYDGSFAAMQIHDESIHWQTSGDYDSNIGVIKALDVNHDGFDDAIYADNRVIKAIDVQHQVILGNYTFDYYVKDFDVLVNDESFKLVVAHNERLSLLSHSGSTFSEQAFIEQSCYRVILLNYDIDAELELLCLTEEPSNYGAQEIVIYDLDDDGFSEVARVEALDTIWDIAVDPSSQSEQKLFITTKGEDEDYYSHNDQSFYVKKATSLGNEIWSSLALIGRPTNHGLKARKLSDKLELMLSTNSLMYWLH